MAKTIAEHYSEELENWDQSLKFYATEMDHIESKLYEILRRNSVVGLAEKVNFETEKLQSELRQKMKGVEKKFISVKYDCNNFLTEVLKN
jgi:hypothetical protein